MYTHDITHGIKYIRTYIAYMFCWTSIPKRLKCTDFDKSISRVSCQKGPTRHAYAWQIGPIWQDTLDMCIDKAEYDTLALTL